LCRYGKIFSKRKRYSPIKGIGIGKQSCLCYAGKLGGIYLKAEVFDFIKACYDNWKDDFRFLMLTNASREEIDGECSRVGLPGEVLFNRFVFHIEIPAYLSLGDFAINPVKPVLQKILHFNKRWRILGNGPAVVISPGISVIPVLLKMRKLVLS
jgi:hypothetical protein